MISVVLYFSDFISWYTSNKHEFMNKRWDELHRDVWGGFGLGCLRIESACVQGFSWHFKWCTDKAFWSHESVYHTHTMVDIHLTSFHGICLTDEPMILSMFSVKPAIWRPWHLVHLWLEVCSLVYLLTCSTSWVICLPELSFVNSQTCLCCLSLFI